MGVGFENYEVGFGKKMKWEMGLVPPSPFRTLLFITTENFTGLNGEF